MGRPKKIQPSLTEAIRNAERAPEPIDEMPLTCLRDFLDYNREAAKLNKKLAVCRYPYKQCPVDIHPKERVIFSRNDQPTNPLPVFLSDDKIHFDQTLIPGRTYDLPKYIVSYLAQKGKATWGWIENPDGSTETRIIDKTKRFSVTPSYRDYLE